MYCSTINQLPRKNFQMNKQNFDTPQTLAHMNNNDIMTEYKITSFWKASEF